MVALFGTQRTCQDGIRPAGGVIEHVKVEGGMGDGGTEDTWWLKSVSSVHVTMIET